MRHLLRDSDGRKSVKTGVGLPSVTNSRIFSQTTGGTPPEAATGHGGESVQRKLRQVRPRQDVENQEHPSGSKRRRPPGKNDLRVEMVQGRYGDDGIERPGFWVPRVGVALLEGNVSPSGTPCAGNRQHRWREVDSQKLMCDGGEESRQASASTAHLRHVHDAARKLPEHPWEIDIRMTESPKPLDGRETVEFGLNGCDIPHGIPIHGSTRPNDRRNPRAGRARRVRKHAA